jgi:CHAD domain-containing protein
MNHALIKHITNNHYRKINKHIKEVCEYFDVEAIHQFRVEYKKLRAFLRMISQELETAGKIKIYKKLKKAYNISGAIRDLQLQQQRIVEATKQELKKPRAYLALLRKEIDKLKPELSEIFFEKPIIKSKRKTDAFIPDEFQLSGFKLLIQKKWTVINAIITSGHYSDDNIHTIRKNLKDLFYNLKEYEIEKHNILSSSIWKEKDELYFNKLLVELGNFQDKCTAIALLKSYWLNRLNTYNRELLERIKKVWIKDKINMKRLIVKKLKADIVPQ